MGQKLPPDQMELYRRTDEVLHYIWDPVGIAGAPEARNEYQSYLPEVFSLLMKDDSQGIRDWLAKLTEEGMGLQPDRARIDETVELLFRWKKICLAE